MDSGQDDVAFLGALALYLHNTTAVAFPALPLGARLSLAGHSNGAMMANRVWCETGDASFDNYFSFEGPPSSYVLIPKLTFSGLLPE